MVLDLWSKLPFQVFSVTSVEEKTRVVVRGPDVKSLVIFKYVADATNMVFIKHDSFNFHLWPSRHKGNQLLHSNPSHALTPDQKCFKINRMYVYKYAISTGLLKKFSSWYMLRS